ncbi:hypothetical protein IMSAGC012_02174 [Lachnospiraceae bacterium]|nr:hypothetical protein IMSAGC012_02174 [Lachnospiraceae bacterium]
MYLVRVAESCSRWNGETLHTRLTQTGKYKALHTLVQSAVVSIPKLNGKTILTRGNM